MVELVLEIAAPVFAPLPLQRAGSNIRISARLKSTETGQALWARSFDGDLTTFFAVMSSCAYAAVVLFIEPFYVAAGFGMYLNRRVELEAWDVEQEFRHAFAH